MIRAFFALLLAALPNWVGAGDVPPSEVAIHDFLGQHPATAGAPVELHFRDSRPRERACAGPLAVTTSNRRLLGRVSFQVRCSAPAWTMVVPVQVSLMGEYWAANTYLPAGKVLGPQDLRKANGDLAALPEDVVRSNKVVLGRLLTRPLSEGAAVPLNALRENAVVKAGERIRVSIFGAGFSVSGEGVAVSGGAVGEVVKLKMPDGQQASGLVIKPGYVEVRVE